MKTKRNLTVALIAVAILGLALWANRQGGGKTAERVLNSLAISAAGAGGVPDSAKPESNEVGANIPGGELSPEMLEPLTTATAQIVRGDGRKLDLRSIDREFERLLVETNEVLAIRLVLMDFDAGRPILVEADNGGSLNRNVGPLALQPAAKDGAIEFQYAIGGHKGRYTVFVSQGDRQELLEFYVGKEPPTGQSGPPRFFNPEHS